MGLVSFAKRPPGSSFPPPIVWVYSKDTVVREPGLQPLPPDTPAAGTLRVNGLTVSVHPGCCNNSATDCFLHTNRSLFLTIKFFDHSCSSLDIFFFLSVSLQSLLHKSRKSINVIHCHIPQNLKLCLNPSRNLNVLIIYQFSEYCSIIHSFMKYTIRKNPPPQNTHTQGDRCGLNKY